MTFPIYGKRIHSWSKPQTRITQHPPKLQVSSSEGFRAITLLPHLLMRSGGTATMKPPARKQGLNQSTGIDVKKWDFPWNLLEFMTFRGISNDVFQWEFMVTNGS